MKNWNTEVWDEVLTIKNGKNQKKVLNPNGAYPIYGSGGVMGFADDYLCEEETTIIGRKGSINNPIYVRTKFWNVDTAFGLCPGERLDNRFFFYFCLTYNFLKHNKATTLPSLTKADLLKIKIPLPPLPEQKKIAEILDAADSLRQKDQQLIDHYNTLSQSLFLDMFGDPVTNPMGWEKQLIGNVCSDIVDCVNKTAKVVAYETKYKMIRTTNVRFYKVDTSNVRYVEKGTYVKWVRRLTPQIGDIIFTREAPVGEAGILESNDKVFLGQRIMEYRADNIHANPYYLLYELMGNNVKRQIRRLSSGSTVKHLSVPDCKKFLINVPPVSLQNQFAKHIQSLEKQKQQAQASLQKSEDLFNSLLQKAFKGELTHKKT